MCSAASVILTRIDKILVSFQAILIYFMLMVGQLLILLNSNVENHWNPFQITSKTLKNWVNTCEYYTYRWTHFSNIESILVSITTTILAKYCQNTCKYSAGEYTLIICCQTLWASRGPIYLIFKKRMGH